MVVTIRKPSFLFSWLEGEGVKWKAILCIDINRYIQVWKEMRTYNFSMNCCVEFVGASFQDMKVCRRCPPFRNTRSIFLVVFQARRMLCHQFSFHLLCLVFSIHVFFGFKFQCFLTAPSASPKTILRETKSVFDIAGIPFVKVLTQCHWLVLCHGTHLHYTGTMPSVSIVIYRTPYP